VVLTKEIATPARGHGQFSVRAVVLHVPVLVAVMGHPRVLARVVGVVGLTVAVDGLGGDVTGPVIVTHKELQ
jgi:hypothetical protein